MVARRPARRPSRELLPQELLSTTGSPIPFPSCFAFPFHRLPPEIRRKIYRLLFRTTVPVYPTIASTSHMAHETIKRTNFPTNLLLVNRQLESEATKVLWGDNEIVFQFPLEWNETPQHQRWFSRSQTFMPQARHLCQIRRLVIEVYLLRDCITNTPANLPARHATSVRRELQAFCNSLQLGHQIRSCEIRFTNIKTYYPPNEVLHTWQGVEHSSASSNPASGCCFNGPGRGFGRKYLQLDELEALCRQSIDVDQQVLEPLSELRGLEVVKVVGRVTPDWAEHLRNCMLADLDTFLPEFEHRTKVSWAESRSGKRKKTTK